GSPAINAGELVNSSNLDMDDELRPAGAGADMGADEWVDADNDGMADWWEIKHFTNLSRNGLGDADSDGLPDAQEYDISSNPSVADTDGDGAGDAAEYAAGSDPNHPDTDRDGMPDGYELTHGLDPLVDDTFADKDGDRIPNLWEYKRGHSPSNAADKPTADAVVAASGGTHTTIQSALNSMTSNWSTPYYSIVRVTPGVYQEQISVYGGQKILLLADLQSTPVEIRASATGYQTVALQGEAVVDGFRITRTKDVDGDDLNGTTGVTISLSEPDDQARLVNCFINGHGSAGAAAVHLGQGRLEISHSTLYDNKTGVDGSILYASYSASLRVVNSIVWNPNAAGYAEIAKDSTGTVSVIGSVVRDGSFGGATTDPLINPRGYLTGASPAVNAGSTTAGVLRDIQGETRASSPDAGADEWRDADSDGLPDWLEALGVTDPNGDNDGDGLTNLDEYSLHGTDALQADADGDGLDDSDEVLAHTNPNDNDTDSDGIPDGYESVHSLNPLLDDALEDKDGDRVPNLWEYKRGTSASNGSLRPADDYVVAQAGGGSHTTIQAAVNSTTASSSSPYYSIIRVKAGVYQESVSISSWRKVLLLADQEAAPVEIRAVNSGTYAVSLSEESVVNGFRITRVNDVDGNPFNGLSGVQVSLPTAQTRARLVNCFIHNHGANQGAGIYVGNGRLEAEHVSVFGNLAANNGRGIYVGYSSRLKLANSIVWNPDGDGETEVYASNPASVTVVSSIIAGGEYGSLAANPFLNPRGYLKAASPALDTAVGSSLLKDIQGESRSGAADIGADEFVDSDSDGLPDWLEALGVTTPGGDADGDDLDNLSEYSLYGTNPQVADTDGDGLDDGDEVAAGTGLLVTDSDLDGMPDGFEVTHGLNPLDYRDALDDKDGDRLPNLFEYVRGKDPSSAASVQAADFTVAATAGSHTSINAAISTANNTGGDCKIILVKKGTYAEHVYLSGKRILLLGEQGHTPPVVSSGSGDYSLTVVQDGCVVDGLVLTHSSATTNSGGVEVSIGANQGHARLVNTIIRGNRSVSGAGIFISDGLATVDHSTVADNAGLPASTATQGWGIHIDSGALRLRNSIVWNPALPASHPQIYKGQGASCEVLNSVVYGGGWGGLFADPVLTPTGFLRHGSPAINTANTPVLPVSANDIHGEARGSTPDLGADEYVDSDTDQLPDAWEMAHLGNLTANGTADSDSDGLTNAQELVYGSHPGLTDTDGDGVSDSVEFGSGSNPAVSDSDGDGMTDLYEVTHGLDPLDPQDALKDKDGDRIPNIYEFKRGTQASVVGSLPAVDITVNPAFVTENATQKKTIMAAVNAANAASGTHKIIFVKSGTYDESVYIGSKAILILGEAGATPPVIANSDYDASLYLQVEHAVVDGLVISHSTSAYEGRGVYVYTPESNDQVRLVNCVIKDNLSSGGAGIYVGTGDLTVEHCTIIDNENAYQYGGTGIHVDGYGRLSLLNSIVWNPEYSPDEAQVYAPSEQTEVVVKRCIILGAEHGASGADPLLDSAGVPDPASPAVDAGVVARGSKITRDIKAKLRDVPPDLGAYEASVDTDSDGLSDAWETAHFGGLSQTGTGDGDGDGLNNLGEAAHGTDPGQTDSDGDGVSDGNEVTLHHSDPALADTDGDGIPDSYEIAHGTNPLVNDSWIDDDSDGHSNLDEYLLGTDPNDGASVPIGVTYSRPVQGESNVPVDKVLVIGLNRPLPVGAVAPDFLLKRSSDGQVVAGASQILHGRQLVAFVPAAPLDADTLYEWEVAPDVANDFVVAPYGPQIFETSANSTAVSKPEVLQTLPGPQYINVAATAVVSTYWSEPLDASTVSSSTFTVYDDQQNVVPATVTYDPYWYRVDVTPVAAMTLGKVYEVVIQTGVTNLRGEQMAAEHRWSFKTVDPPLDPPLTGPYVTTTFPVNRYVNVSPQVSVKLTWSEAMDASTLTSANVKLITGWTGQTVPAVLSYNSLLKRLDIIPLAALANDTAYIVRVSADVKSQAGANFEQSEEWELHFRTMAASTGTGGSTGGGTVGGDGSGGQPGNPPGSGNPGPGGPGGGG
ncbi:Ig-like domain-containing protein, partial [Verrucomicrobium sp. BvORR106]|uniref:Ig-like domain-containing protein n=1 Tax=Verrucomicrobium sp. BvORR106 TaxID=1403819 RepID=UPI000570F301